MDRARRGSRAILGARARRRRSIHSREIDANRVGFATHLGDGGEDSDVVLVEASAAELVDELDDPNDLCRTWGTQ